MDMMSLRRRVMVNQNKLMTATGNPITFNTPLTKPLKECVVKFTPKQSGSGTPSPENVREIVGKNGITVWQSGKNLCPELTDTDYWSIKGYFVSSGAITLNSGYRMCDYHPIKPDTDYTFSTSGAGWKGIGFYDVNYEPVSYKQANAVTVSLKSPSNARYYRIYSVYNAKANNIQLEIGTTATEYEVYAPVETSVSFDDAPQDVDPSEVADTIYGGYVDISKGELVAEWMKVDMGELPWRLYEKCWSCIPSGIKTHSTAFSQVADLVCDIYAQGRVTTASQFRDTPEGQLVARNNYTDIGIRDSSYTSAADFKTAVTGHYLAYKLAEPIHYPLPPRILTTLQGANTMWSDANGDITVKYWTR
jgi:hypothetical protein